MHTTRGKSFVVLVIGLLIGTMAPIAGQGQASEFRKFHTALADAYPHYRETLFYLRTGNSDVALVELQKWTEKWQDITVDHGPRPPDVYADDTTWKATLTKIFDLSTSGLSQARTGRVKRAVDDLKDIRWILSKLRRRNHVVIFSDHVDRANQLFDRLFVFRHAPPEFANQKQVDHFRAAVSYATLAYQLVMDNAPTAYRDDPEFQRLMKQSFHSFDRLWVAINARNRLNLINILREMRSSDRMLYLRFG